MLSSCRCRFFPRFVGFELIHPAPRNRYSSPLSLPLPTSCIFPDALIDVDPFFFCVDPVHPLFQRRKKSILCHRWQPKQKQEGRNHPLRQKWSRISRLIWGISEFCVLYKMCSNGSDGGNWWVAKRVMGENSCCKLYVISIKVQGLLLRITHHSVSGTGSSRSKCLWNRSLCCNVEIDFANSAQTYIRPRVVPSRIWIWSKNIIEGPGCR